MLEDKGIYSQVPYGGGDMTPNLLHPHNCDPYNSRHCGGGMGAVTTGGAAPAPRMKKMKKK